MTDTSQSPHAIRRRTQRDAPSSPLSLSLSLSFSVSFRQGTCYFGLQQQKREGKNKKGGENESGGTRHRGVSHIYSFPSSSVSKTISVASTALLFHSSAHNTVARVTAAALLPQLRESPFGHSPLFLQITTQPDHLCSLFWAICRMARLQVGWSWTFFGPKKK